MEFKNPFKGIVENDAVRNWLKQFDPEHLHIVLRLLDSFNYFTPKKVEDYVTQLSKSIKTKYENKKGKTWFVPVGYVAKSGSMIAYYYRNQNNIPLDAFTAPNDISTLPLTENDSVIFLDDFLGSGNQSIQVWETVVKPILQDIKINFGYAVLIGYADGITKLKALTDFDTFVVEEIESKDLPFSEDSVIYSDPSERKQAMEIIESYGKRLYLNHPLGYNNSQGLVGFFYSTPNNTLPIFWSSQNGWKPILSHGESYRDPEFLIGPPIGLRKETISYSSRTPIYELDDIENYEIDPDLFNSITAEFRKIRYSLVIASIVKELNINANIFKDTMRIINDLRTLKHEKVSVCSAILIVPGKTDHSIFASRIFGVKEGINSKSLSEIQSMANLIDGLDGAIVMESSGDILGNFLYNDNEFSNDSFLPDKYKKAAMTSQLTSGLLFIFLGNNRIVTFYRGQRVLSHRNASWHLYGSELNRAIKSLSATHGIDVPVLQTVFRICFLLSDQEYGAVMTIGDHEAVLQYCDKPKTEFLDWDKMHIDETSDIAIVGLLIQDGATIISGSGEIIQGMTFIRPPAGTDAEEETGRGSKHSTAAKISKITNTVSIAVSDDGRVTVYSKGSIFIKLMG